MLLYLLYPLHVSVGFFNVFKYITFRAFGASITAVLLSILIGPAYIRFLQKMQMGQVIRSDGPQSHLSKKGTPTMGGGLILLSICVSTFLWADLTNKNIWISVITTVLFGVVGYIDDYRKVVKKNPKGLSARQKLIGQTVIALVASYLIYVLRDTPPVLKFPFLKDISLYLGPMFVLFSTLVIVGASNAVNLTDGSPLRSRFSSSLIAQATLKSPNTSKFRTSRTRASLRCFSRQ
jgi:phospho-N-acetylmuramoyl-pentapeptide-transferase